MLYLCSIFSKIFHTQPWFLLHLSSIFLNKFDFYYTLVKFKKVFLQTTLIFVIPIFNFLLNKLDFCYIFVQFSNPFLVNLDFCRTYLQFFFSNKHWFSSNFCLIFLENLNLYNYLQFFFSR